MSGSRSDRAHVAKERLRDNAAGYARGIVGRVRIRSRAGDGSIGLDDAPPGVSTLTTIVNGMPPEIDESPMISSFPVMVPDVLVQVAAKWVAQLLKDVPAGSKTVTTGRSAGFGPRLVSSSWYVRFSPEITGSGPTVSLTARSLIGGGGGLRNANVTL